MNRIAAGLVVLAASLPMAVALARYPAKPIRMVVPWPAGGTVDGVARVIGPSFSAGLGRTIVIENKAGAGGSIGQAEAAKAPPDGHTVLHVFDKEHVPQFMDHMPEALETWNTEFLERYFEECEVRLETRAGESPAAVLEVAATERADMIVLSWGQDLSQDRANLVREVLTSASVPVMLVPLKPGVPRDVLEPSG